MGPFCKGDKELAREMISTSHIVVNDEAGANSELLSCRNRTLCSTIHRSLLIYFKIITEEMLQTFHTESDQCSF